MVDADQSRVDAPGAGFRGDALGNLSHAAAHHAPAAAHSVHLAHDMMEKNIGGSACARTGQSADDRLTAQQGLQLFRFKPGVQELLGAGDHHLDLGVQVLLQTTDQARHAE